MTDLKELVVCEDFCLPILLPSSKLGVTKDTPSEREKKVSLIQTVAVDIANMIENTKDENGEIMEQRMVDLIGNTLGYKNVFILIPNDNDKKFYIKGGFGTSRDSFEKANFPIENGICGHVYQNKVAHLANFIDLDNGVGCSHYLEIIGLDSAKSEFATPIILRSKIIGILDIQSDIYNAFSDEDIFIISTIANLIALKMETTYRKSIEQEEIAALSIIEEATSANLYGKSSKQLFDEFAERLISQFGADLVTLYPLAPGTGYPLTPPLVFGKLNAPNYIKRNYLSKNSILFHLFSSWKPEFFEKAQENKLFVFPLQEQTETIEYQRFVVRENIISTVFVPLGTLVERVGILFLNFRHQALFDRRRMIELQAISNMYAIQLIIAQQRELRESSLFLGSPDVHTELDLKFSFILDELKRSLEDDVSKNEILLNIDKKLREILDDILLQLSSKVEKFDNLYSLEKRISQFVGMLQQSFQQKINIETVISENVFYSGTAINQAIYAVVCEAMLNSAKHGKAKNIKVKVTKEPDSIEIIINDDGCGFDVNKKYSEYLRKHNLNYGSTSGIFSRVDALKTLFGAEVNIVSEDGAGARITILVPLIKEAKDDYE